MSRSGYATSSKCSYYKRFAIPQPERRGPINTKMFSTGGGAKGRVNGKGKAEGGTMEVG